MRRCFGVLTAFFLGVIGLGVVGAGGAWAQAVIGADEAQRLQASGAAVLVDVRTPEERGQGYPAGSVSIPWAGDEKGFAAAVLAQMGGDRTAPLLLICRSGNRSARAAAVLAGQGFTGVKDVAEGFSGGNRGPGWRNRGLPVAGGP